MYLTNKANPALKSQVRENIYLPHFVPSCPLRHNIRYIQRPAYIRSDLIIPFYFFTVTGSYN